MNSINDPVLYLKASELSIRLRISIIENRIGHLRENHVGSAQAESMIETWYKVMHSITNEWNGVYKVMLECGITTLTIPNFIYDQVEMKDTSLIHGSDKLVNLIYICCMEGSYTQLEYFVC